MAPGVWPDGRTEHRRYDHQGPGPYRPRSESLAAGHPLYYEDLLAADLAGILSRREEVARDLHDYARALVGANRTSDARQTLDLAWDIPDQTGAWLWKPQIRKLREFLNQP